MYVAQGMFQNLFRGKDDDCWVDKKKVEQALVRFLETRASSVACSVQFYELSTLTFVRVCSGNPFVDEGTLHGGVLAIILLRHNLWFHQYGSDSDSHFATLRPLSDVKAKEVPAILRNYQCDQFQIWREFLRQAIQLNEDGWFAFWIVLEDHARGSWLRLPEWEVLLERILYHRGLNDFDSCRSVRFPNRCCWCRWRNPLRFAWIAACVGTKMK